MQIVGALAFGAFNGGMMWIYYLAIEPYARRFWPDALLGWTRLLSGHIRDPRVGRELLIGLVLRRGRFAHRPREARADGARLAHSRRCRWETACRT